MVPAALIAEPNLSLIYPYCYLYDHFRIFRFPHIGKSIKEISIVSPSLVLLSSSFSTDTILHFLQAYKAYCRDKLQPLIIVIDLTRRLNFIPGLSWANKIRIIDNQVPQPLFEQIVKQLVHSA